MQSLQKNNNVLVSWRSQAYSFDKEYYEYYLEQKI